MQIVIDIPEEMYQHAVNGTYCGTLYEELKNGTPLPKGHGRLIDEYTLGEIIYSMYVNKKITNTKYNTFLEILDYVPTIIEADKAVSE